MTGWMRLWSGRVLASDPQVVAVTIRQSFQEYDGQMWKAGRHVQTVTRDDATTTAAAGSGPASPQARAFTLITRPPGSSARPLPGGESREQVPDPPARPHRLARRAAEP